MSGTQNTIQTNDGQKIELSGQSREEYVAWRKAYINIIGHVLTAKFPEFYGRVEFNLQGGNFVNANMADGIKGVPVDEGKLSEIVKYFDEVFELNRR